MSFRLPLLASCQFDATARRFAGTLSRAAHAAQVQLGMRKLMLVRQQLAATGKTPVAPVRASKPATQPPAITSSRRRNEAVNPSRQRHRSAASEPTQRSPRPSQPAPAPPPLRDRQRKITREQLASVRRQSFGRPPSAKRPTPEQIERERAQKATAVALEAQRTAAALAAAAAAEARDDVGAAPAQITLRWRAPPSPFGLDDAWALPVTVADLLGAPLRVASYGTVVELPEQAPLDVPLERAASPKAARATMTTRMTQYLSTVMHAAQCPAARVTTACAWWRLDVADAPRRVQLENAFAGTRRAALATKQLQGLVSQDVYDMSRFAKLHALVGGARAVPDADRTSLQRALDLMVVARRDALAVAAVQAGNTAAQAALSTSTRASKSTTA
jgi:hypothetical protein